MFSHRQSARLFDNCRQMVGRETHLLGIEADIALVHTVCACQLKKALQQLCLVGDVVRKWHDGAAVMLQVSQHGAKQIFGSGERETLGMNHLPQETEGSA